MSVLGQGSEQRLGNGRLDKVGQRWFKLLNQCEQYSATGHDDHCLTTAYIKPFSQMVSSLIADLSTLAVCRGLV